MTRSTFNLCYSPINKKIICMDTLTMISLSLKLCSIIKYYRLQLINYPGFFVCKLGICTYTHI